VFGWALIIALFAQAAGGLARFRLARAKWMRVHSLLGRSVLFLAAFQLLSGYVLLSGNGTNVGILAWGAVHFLLLSLISVLVYRRLKQRALERADAMGPEESPGFVELQTETSGMS
jgi:hypothetical protein